MENQTIENEVIVEEVVETEGKTKWYKSGWFKGTLLAVGGIVVGAVAQTLLGGKSDELDAEGEAILDVLEEAEANSILLAETNEDEHNGRYDFKEEL